MANHSSFISAERAATNKLLEAIDELHNLKDEWDALDLGNTLVYPDDFVGNEDIAIADLAAVIGTTLTAIDALLADGNATNLYTLKN